VLVAEAQNELRRRMELDPVRFFKHDLQRYMDSARRAIGAFVNAPAEDLARVGNATVAVATTMHAAALGRGDEVVVTNHEYRATTNELDRICAATGAKKVVAHVPFTGVTPDDVVDAVLGAITPRTKLVIVSHIASGSALVFPVERIVPEVRRRGVEILVDGAHAPGQVAIDIDSLRPTYYAASSHKWLCTPKGTGFFYAEPGAQGRVEPLALSCRFGDLRPDRKAFLCNFDYVGTNDYSGNLTTPVAIAHMGAQMPGGWDELRRRNHAMARAGAQVICERLGLDEPAPASMTGSMVALRLPDHPDGLVSGKVYDDPIWDALAERHRIQVPIWDLPGLADRVMRISAQLYNRLDDYARLGEALAVELGRERG
jgi:isopenicillin-N epimerase